MAEAMTHWTGVCVTVCIGQLSTGIHKSSTIDVPDSCDDLIQNTNNTAERSTQAGWTDQIVIPSNLCLCE